jgi:Uma2 family endonuclease
MQNPEAIVEPGAFLTAADLARLPEDGRTYQLVEGRLVSMPPTGTDHDTIGFRLILAVGNFVQAHQLGECTLSQSGYLVSRTGQPDSVLVPDLAFVSAARVPKAGTSASEGFWRLAPDLVVEIVSPSQHKPEMAETARRWLAAGVRLVWIVWPSSKQVDVWRPGSNQPTQTLGASDTLDGLDVLPGFSHPVAQLFR